MSSVKRYILNHSMHQGVCDQKLHLWAEPHKVYILFPLVSSLFTHSYGLIYPFCARCPMVVRQSALMWAFFECHTHTMPQIEAHILFLTGKWGLSDDHKGSVGC